MDKLLKEAIADAKAVRETALANAKIALEEAFAPKLQSMLNARINEEDDEEMEDEEEVDETTEATYEGEDEEENDEEEVDETASKEDDEEEEEEEEESTDENFDLDAIIAELEKEDSTEDDEEVEETADKKSTESDDEEIDLEELLKSLGESEDEEEEEEKEANENSGRVAELETQLSEYRDAVVYLKDKINEINLLNAKLLYTNKLFKTNDALTETQKVKILESLDRTKSIREVKLVYSTLAESFSKTPKSSKKRITESLGFASKTSGKTKKQILDGGNALAERFQLLANIKKAGTKK